MDRAITALAVDDEDDWRTAIQASLALFGIQVEGVGSAASFYERIAGKRFDLVIVDLGLPDDDGLSIVRHLTDTPGGPGVIILTGRGGTEDRIKGFATGADLYFAKPVDMRELAVAAVRLAQRLRLPYIEPANPVSPKPGDQWILRSGQWMLEAPGGQVVRLTAKEMTLMEAFATAGDSVATHANIFRDLGYTDDDSGRRNLDALVRRLRIKIDDAGTTPLPIQNVHGIGYVFSGALKKT